ncbi:MAG: glycosyltransferase family 4 protein [Deltaproteobacteria bacterium]|nr:glycosyltransferase family 4 protein [Deltaproteobacteria bacterium]
MSSRPLRIALLAYRGNMRSGGQGIYLWFLARELARLGHAVHVLAGPPHPDPMPFAASLTCIPNEGFWARRFDPNPAAILPQPNPLRIFEPLNFWEYGATWFGFLPEPFAFSVRAVRTLLSRVRAGERFDLVHDVQSLGWATLLLKAIGLPVVTTIHHPLSVDRRASFARDRSFREALGTMELYPVGMQAFVARQLDRVLTSSAQSGREIVRDFRVRPERLRMVWNGLDTDLFRPLAGVSRSSAELLCVARAADPNKGVPVLLEALARLPAHVTLTLVDEASAENPARERARALGVEGRVHITGRVETHELLQLYARASLVVVPSLYEGFGLPAAEAMACGAPVVATAAGALPEVMRVGAGGVLVPPGDPAALAEGILGLLASPETRIALGARARARIIETFSWPRVAQATLAVYVELLDERRRRAANA